MKIIRFITNNSPSLIENDIEVYKKEFYKFSFVSEISIIIKNPIKLQFKDINFFGTTILLA